MPVLHDYKCPRHGYFESMKAKCPMKDCHEEVFVVYLQPPAGYFTRKNKMSKKQLEAEQKAVEEKKLAEQRTSGVIWGGDGRYSMGNVLKGGAVRSVAGESVGFNPKDAGNLTGPRTASYTADHENLKIK